MAQLDELARAGLLAIEERRFDAAIAAFQGAIGLAPDRPDLHNALGMAHLHRGDAGNAIDELECAVRLAEPYDKPEHQAAKREFHLSLATAYQIMDRVDHARDALASIVERWPDLVEARLQLGQLLLKSGRPEQGCDVFEEAADYLDKDQRASAEALVGTIRTFLASGEAGSVFLEAHADSYRKYFDEVVGAQAEHGWYAEAARMAQGPSGELVPMLADNAKPYAFERVDLVNPADGTVSSVYSETEPMVVGVEGFEALAQVPVLFRWPGHPFEVWVSSRCPWHWLSVVVQLRDASGDDLATQIDPVIGAWYLEGYNGTWGEKESGRFHYVTDPELLGGASLAYVVDLGRARFDAIPDLLRRLVQLHEGGAPIRRVLFGEGHLPDSVSAR